MNEPDLTEIAALIDQSSLGTGEAVALRAATPPDAVRQVVRDATATGPEPAVRHDTPSPPPGHLTAVQRTSRGDGQAGTPGMAATRAAAAAGHSAIATMGAMAAMTGAFAAGAEALSAAAGTVAGVTGSATEDAATTDANLPFEGLNIAAAPPVIGL